MLTTPGTRRKARAPMKKKKRKKNPGLLIEVGHETKPRGLCWRSKELGAKEGMGGGWVQSLFEHTKTHTPPITSVNEEGDSKWDKEPPDTQHA